MSMLVADCPRCGAGTITFDVRAQHLMYYKYDWQPWFEVFCICRACIRSTVFVLGLEEYNETDIFSKSDALVNFPTALNKYFKIAKYISARDNVAHIPPESLSGIILASCLAFAA